MEKRLTEQEIEDIFERRGGFALAAKYPGKVSSYVYVRNGKGEFGAPDETSYSVVVSEDGTFSLEFHPSFIFAVLKMERMSGFDDDKRFASVTANFEKAVRRLEREW